MWPVGSSRLDLTKSSHASYAVIPLLDLGPLRPGTGVFVFCDRVCPVFVFRCIRRGEYALVVVAVVAAGVGDVGEPGAAECACDQVAAGGVGIGLVPGADPLEIFGECLVSDVVRTVFNGPVAAGIEGQVAGSGQVRGQAGDAVGDLLLLSGAVRGAGVAADAQDLGGVRPVAARGEGGADAAPLAAAVSFALFGP